jgi:acyl dehydratase
VRPGDRLSIRDEVLEVRPSTSKPDRGVVRVRMETLNQNGEIVQSFIANLIVLRRPTA